MKQTITSQIEDQVFKLLKNNPEGISWSEMLRQITNQNSSFHPKTINGILWKLPQKYPNKVKKIKGIFLFKQ